MAKTPKKTVADVERIIGDWTSTNCWYLLPRPDSTMKNPQKAMQDAVDKSRVSLVHEDWEKCAEDARTLSGQGGVSEVLVARVKRRVSLLAGFRNGKSVRAKQ
jgi:hypothetical protein